VAGRCCSGCATAPHPELYNLELDPAESYDAAVDYPERVKEIEHDIDALIPTFPENVQIAYSELKANPGSPLMPAGTATRSADLITPNSMYVLRGDETTAKTVFKPRFFRQGRCVCGFCSTLSTGTERQGSGDLTAFLAARE
jgi:hypothetical protein